MTKASKKTHKYLKWEINLGIYKMFQREPLKVFLKKDFGGNSISIKTHLLFLEKLGLIEQVPVLIKVGNNCVRKDIKGYKLVRDKIDKP